MKKIIYSLALCLLAVTAIKAQVPSYVPTSGLAAWYSFTGTSNDLSGNSNNPTGAGVTYVADRFGNSNAAANFNGTSAVLTVNTPTFTFSETGAFTYSVWLKKSTQTSAGVVLMCGSNATGNFISNIQGQTEIQFGVNKQQSAWVWATCPHTLNQWDHYAAVYDNGALTVYKNGAYSGSATYTNWGALSVNLPFYIGRGLPGATNYYVGAMDDIGVWTRALTQPEIINLYNSFPLDITKTEAANQFAIYPNPAVDVLTITPKVNKPGIRYFIYDQVGNQILTGPVDKVNAVIDIHELAAGNYMIQVGESTGQHFTIVRD